MRPFWCQPLRGRPSAIDDHSPGTPLRVYDGVAGSVTRWLVKADRSTLIGIALLCSANLLLEVLITRLFSATMFYHFTFMAVGLAMFGVAASGVYVFL
ncbi:MAG: hypothetical protein JWO36_6689, partial [Myxococcales bacterium]|nr:hypothetical protein [Myxococcales bacterium]